jgi:hypothetical protein
VRDQRNGIEQMRDQYAGQRVRSDVEPDGTHQRCARMSSNAQHQGKDANPRNQYDPAHQCEG